MGRPGSFPPRRCSGCWTRRGSWRCAPASAGAGCKRRSKRCRSSWRAGGAAWWWAAARRATAAPSSGSSRCRAPAARRPACAPSCATRPPRHWPPRCCSPCPAQRPAVRREWRSRRTTSLRRRRAPRSAPPGTATWRRRPSRCRAPGRACSTCGRRWSPCRRLSACACWPAPTPGRHTSWVGRSRKRGRWPCWGPPGGRRRRPRWGCRLRWRPRTRTTSSPPLRWSSWSWQCRRSSSRSWRPWRTRCSRATACSSTGRPSTAPPATPCPAPARRSPRAGPPSHATGAAR
mmetsp:Transcript_12350/g.31606  ORF Transcript_12350/g.31606 Transcript_12350/m.31606 type:complete len:289 (+) Transcript_12350:308-1174(+)